MKNFLVSAAFIAASLTTFAQVGVGTDTPNATLEVKGDAANATALDGIIAPRLTGVELRAKTYTAAQTGAMVYVTAADSAPAGQTLNVTATGYYQYDGTVWQAFASDGGKFVDGTTTADAVYTGGNVGIGTTTPNSALDVAGYIKVGSSDATGDVTPVNGMIRFNTGTNKFQGYANGAWVDLH